MKKNLSRTLKVLQKFGQFEVDASGAQKMEKFGFAQPETVNVSADKSLAEIEFALNFLENSAEEKKSFREKFIGEQIFFNAEKAEKIAAKFDFKKVVEKCAKIEESLNSARGKIEKIDEEIAAVKNWENLHLPLNFPQSLKTVEIRIGRVPARQSADFKIEFAKISLAGFSEISVAEKHTFFLVFWHREAEKTVAENLQNFDFETEDLSHFENRADRQLSILNDKKTDLEKEIESLISARKKLATENLQNLKLTFDFLRWEKSRQNSRGKVFQSTNSAVLNGWVPVKNLTKLEKILTENFDENFAVQKLEPAKNESPPVELKNSKFVAPFANVTKMFGLPAAHEIDPTPFLAPFFALFFGFCLTDAGYGILIAIATAAALKFLPLSKDLKSMVKLVFFCGVATILMGAIFGGWFGIPPDAAPSWATKVVDGKILYRGQIFDFMTDLTDKIMPVAFALGFLHLFLGIILAGIINLKNGKIALALQTNFLLAAFILLLAVFGIASKIPAAAEFAPILKNAVLISLPILIVAMGAGNRWFLRPIFGILAIVDEAMGWLSNLLSYSRLFALGLATGIIANIFNSLAIIFGEMLPIGANFAVGAVIILFGHSINIGLNLLGAYIHSGRLQFVEFFGKFAQFGGRKFEPLRRDGRFLWE